MNMEKTFCVYMHTNKLNGKKYIGQTCQKPELRWGIDGKKYRTSTHFWNAIQKYGWNNFEHDVLYKNLSLQEANEKEKELIAKYNTTDMSFGYNLEHGGINGFHSEETKAKISKAHKGKTFSKEHLENLSKAHKGMNMGKNNPNFGKKPSAETSRKMSDAKKDIYNGTGNPNSKCVLQYDLSGNFIKEWEYISMASAELGICLSSIGQCCRGKQRKAGGYIWRFKESQNGNRKGSFAK